ncbi:MAG: hypothetical protein ACRENK_07160 [Gemmatimonadaceae bacterium]
MTTYGLTFNDVLRIGIVTSTLGILLLAIEVAVGHAHGTLAAHLTTVVAVPTALAFGPPLLIGTFGLTDIALVGDQIQLRLGRRVIDRQQIADLTGISLRGHAAALVLRFRDGSRMRLFAIPVPRRQALRDALLAHVPDAGSVMVRG